MLELMNNNKAVYTKHADKIFDKRYNSPNLLRRYVHRAQYQSVIHFVNPGESVLDIGCGEGVLSCLLAQIGVHVTGVDISEPNIAAAQALARRLGVEDRTTFLLGDAENVPFPDNSFDTVISCHVLEHLPDFDKGLREVRRVTRSCAIIALPTILNLCSLVQAGQGSFWEFSRKSLLALPLGFFRALGKLLGEGVDEGYMGQAELTHIWRWPWVIRRRLRQSGLTLVDFEASTMALPYFAFFLPVIKFLDQARDWPVIKNFGYGSTALVRKTL